MYCAFLASHSSRKHKGHLAMIRNPTDIISMQWHSQKVCLNYSASFAEWPKQASVLLKFLWKLGNVV